VPRAFARLQNDNYQRLRSPLANLALSRQNREKSGDKGPGGIFSGSDMQDLIQTMSNGTNERTNADLQGLGATAPG